jgi:hypothetical protein
MNERPLLRPLPTDLPYFSPAGLRDESGYRGYCLSPIAIGDIYYGIATVPSPATTRWSERFFYKDSGVWTID